MDTNRFDLAIRSLAVLRSRRQTVLAIALGSLGLTNAHPDTAAGTGCRNVGKACKNAGQCCSGVCKGKKDKKKCKAHDTGGCLAGQQEGACGGVSIPCTSAAGEEGQCDTTTGNAGYCVVDGQCFACQKDADCRPFCGAGAACIVCAEGCPATGGTACVGPDACNFPPV